MKITISLKILPGTAHTEFNRFVSSGHQQRGKFIQRGLRSPNNLLARRVITANIQRNA